MIGVAAAAAIGFLRRVPRQVWYALAAVALAWLAYSWAYNRGAASRDAEVDGLNAALAACAGANKSNQQTIADLRAANAKWAKSCAFDEAASGKDAQTVEANRDALPRDDNRRQQEREKIYERQPIDAEWGRTRVPDRVAARLRR